MRPTIPLLIQSGTTFNQ
ncbi:hypothetical protein pdam_00000428 [Pocillopora damicornis]|uniref:Uncharacterized protein n=1 Tax=Pocillopora damicornis TaxID=46731 RepID=A0A3M6UJ85_POCDA|nr:hypothetical protein pdam_00000428 [Pocillopora damicornis]